MKIVILGYNSFVGSALIEFYSKNKSVDLMLVGRKDNLENNFVKFEVPSILGDIGDATKKLIYNLELDAKTIVINCISMGDVDKCETDKNSCDLQNFHFVKLFYENLSKGDFARFIHLSTNAVYDGEGAPYSEISKCNPINYYGMTKLKTDEYLLSRNDNKVIVARPITMYGKVPSGGRANPVSMIVEKLQADQSLSLVDDVFVNILYVGDLVRVIDKLIKIEYTGLINISGNEIYSRYELGLEIALLLGSKASLIESVTSSEFSTVAKRPRNTSFNNNLMKSLGIEAKSLREVILSLA